MPKGIAENLRYRRKMYVRAMEDPDARAALMHASANDFLFWVDAFVWTFDPRSAKRNRVQPFITYPFQEDALATLHGSLGERDVLIQKSRDQGASWMILILFLWAWLFKDGVTFLLVSRTENLVDKTHDPDSLMWKLDFMLERLPVWMAPPVVPKLDRTNLHLRNPLNGSIIDGTSTTGNVGRGGRRTAIMLDEFAAFEIADGFKALAATQRTTQNRIFNSTPQGVGTAHSKMWHSNITKLRFHWSEHPVQSKGLYTAKDGILQVLDKNYVFPDGYPFILDGKLRSPFYDAECERCGNVNSIVAQELDIEELGSGSQFFDADMVHRLLANPDVVMPPFLQGDLDYHVDPVSVIGFHARANGRLKLWVYPDQAGEMPKDRNFCVGVDTSAGTGASNSCIAVGDRKTGEVVARFTSPFIRPEQLAEYAVALCKWFRGNHGDGALLIWEENGPGQQFRARVVEMGYRHFFYRERENKATREKTTSPGWYPTAQAKRVLLSEYQVALAMGRIVERDKETLEEMLEYVFGTNGEPIHVKAASSMDSSGAKSNHGDRVISGGLVALGMKDVAEVRLQDRPVPPMSYLGLRKEWESKQARRAWTW